MKDIIEELAKTPLIVGQSGKIDRDSHAVSLRDATLDRRLVAKLNYLAMDRPDIRYAASTMGSPASSPKNADMVRLKRVGRFLIGRPITWTHYRWRVRSDRIMAYTDSDSAANREDRRSVSGGMPVHSGGLLRFCELYAAASTGAETLGLQSGLGDFGNNTRVTIACDNQGVVQHTARQGLGVAKHVYTRRLWLHAARDEGTLDVVKIPTERSPADLLAKPVPFDRIQDLSKLVGVECDQDSMTLEVQCSCTRCPRI